ncbi:hypothetical protein J6590_103023, partial [Homalodisca vitripennis]
MSQALSLRRQCSLATPHISGWMRLSGGPFRPRPQRTSLLDSSIGRNLVSALFRLQRNYSTLSQSLHSLMAARDDGQ